VKVAETFVSVDGEANHWGQGVVSFFVRLAGCNLRCPYCDTKWAQAGDVGEEVSVGELVSEVEEVGVKKVTITGGEPLLQWDELKELVLTLIHRGYMVTVETNGSINPPFDFGHLNFGWVVDYKLHCPDMMQEAFFKRLTRMDVVKFVIASADDFVKAVDVVQEILPEQVPVALSPLFVEGEMIIRPDTLLFWIRSSEVLERRFVYVSVQLHKLVGLR